MRKALQFRPLSLCGALFVACGAWLLSPSALCADDTVDTALLVSVDVSNSVDEHRYRLQMEGIAAALEDSAVMDAILNGPQSAILFALVEWSDRPQLSIPWTKIATKTEAKAVAATIRKLPRNEGEFTCVANMLRFAFDKIVTQIPSQATHIVIDVSGDGVDNCNGKETTDAVRDELIASGVVINGLPILESDASGPLAPKSPGAHLNASPSPGAASEPFPLEVWYREHVMGGTGAFVLPAYGYEDFGRAMREKFVVEVSYLFSREDP